MEFTKKNYLNKRIEEFKSNGKKPFNLMYDIIGKVKENSLPNDGISEQNLASIFCNFILDKITNIRNMLKDYSNFVLDKDKELGMR